MPALVSLLYNADGTASPSAAHFNGEEAAFEALMSLSKLSRFNDSLAAILATDAPLRLRGTLRGATVAGLAPDVQAVCFLAALVKLISSGVLPAAALIDTGALARLTQLSQGGNIVVTLLAVKVLLASLNAAENTSDLRPLVDALGAVLRAFGPMGVHKAASAASARSLGLLMRALSPQKNRPDKDARPCFPSEAGQALSEMLVADAHFITGLCGVIQASPDLVFEITQAGPDLEFDRDLEKLDPTDSDVKRETFAAFYILWYLDRCAGPGVAARLATLAPESVLHPVRAAAAALYGRSSMARTSGTSAERGGGASAAAPPIAGPSSESLSGSSD